jgi:ABC-type antimicrobial peptide transport system permease subunit
VSYSAVQRTREIGIRLALGAAPRAIARLVIGGGASLVGAGVIVGLGAAALVTRALSRFFVLVGANDASTFVIVTALLAAIALFACSLLKNTTGLIDSVDIFRVGTRCPDRWPPPQRRPRRGTLIMGP